jgi:hypothetical protein
MHGNHRLTLTALDNQVRAALPYLDATVLLEDTSKMPSIHDTPRLAQGAQTVN